MKWLHCFLRPNLSKILKVFMCLAVSKLCLLFFLIWQTLDTGRMFDVQHLAVIASASAQEEEIPAEQKKELTKQAEEKVRSGSAVASTPLPGKAPVQKAVKDTKKILDKSVYEKRMEELRRRERELKALEKKINTDMTELEKHQTSLQRMLDEAKKIRAKKERHLVDIFANMKAKSAAEVLETMDEADAVKILSGLRGRQAGEILTYVKPEIAARLAEALSKMQIPFE